MIFDFDASSKSISFLSIIFSIELQTYCLVNSDFEHRNFLCVKLFSIVAIPPISPRKQPESIAYIETRNKLNNCSGAVPALSGIRSIAMSTPRANRALADSRAGPLHTAACFTRRPPRYRVRRSVTTAAGGAPEHLRPADPKLFATVSRQKSRHNNPGQLSSAVAQRLLRPSELCRRQPAQHQNWECCCRCGFHYLIFLLSPV